MRGELHFFKIDHTDLVRTHGTHKRITIASCIERVVRLFHRERFDDPLLSNVDDIDAVAITNRHDNQLPVGSDGTLIRLSV